MNKTMLLMKHEFFTTIRRKAFIILTLAFPVIALVGILAAQIIPGMITPSGEIMKIGYVDETGIFTETPSQEQIELVPFNTEDDAKNALIHQDIREYFIIPPDYISVGLIQRYTLKSEIEPSATIRNLVNDFLLSNLLRGNTADIIERAKSPIYIASITLTADGTVAERQGGLTALILPIVFSTLLMIAIFFSSGYLLQGLGEEKENRVMEILLSSVSPSQLMAGKIIGLGAVGLLQIIIWIISANFLVRFASSSFANILGALQVTPDFWILAIVYFILGYLLLAVIFSAIGAVASTAREGQQLTPIFTIAILIPVYFMGLIMQNPDNIVVKLLTFIPFTAPTTVIIRLGLSEIPLWELLVSISILIISIILFFILATKLFRTYLLMYGKRPNVKEIVRMFKSS
jgi:ABC-2 type transport system permease protein